MKLKTKLRIAILIAIELIALVAYYHFISVAGLFSGIAVIVFLNAIIVSIAISINRKNKF